MKYQLADIVRFKPEEEEFGLYEVTGYSADGEITITDDECNSEYSADENALILVCPAKGRRDITLEDENQKYKEALEEVRACIDSFYDNDSPRRLHPELVKFAGTIQVMDKATFEALK